MLSSEGEQSLSAWVRWLMLLAVWWLAVPIEECWSHFRRASSFPLWWSHSTQRMCNIWSCPWRRFCRQIRREFAWTRCWSSQPMKDPSSSLSASSSPRLVSCQIALGSSLIECRWSQDRRLRLLVEWLGCTKPKQWRFGHQPCRTLWRCRRRGWICPMLQAVDPCRVRWGIWIEWICVLQWSKDSCRGRGCPA